MELLLPDQDVTPWEYAEVVTNSSYALESMAQLYRDRADAESGFDDLKNQWSWPADDPEDVEYNRMLRRAVDPVERWTNVSASCG